MKINLTKLLECPQRVKYVCSPDRQTTGSYAPIKDETTSIKSPYSFELEESPE